MRLKLEDLSEEFIEEHKLRDKVTKDRYVYVEIFKGMYGLPQAGILAQELLEKVEATGTRGHKQVGGTADCTIPQRRKIYMAFGCAVSRGGYECVGGGAACGYAVGLFGGFDGGGGWGDHVS